MGHFHDWSEKDFDWTGLNEAITLIYTILTRYGRMHCSAKEKWGVARISVSFWYGSLHELIMPRYVYKQFPNWLWQLDCDVITPVFCFLKLPNLFYVYQKFIYNYAYQKAIKKYPHLKEEILVDSYYPELIVGAMEVRDRYWKKV